MQEYTLAAEKTKAVGKYLAKFLNVLNDHGVDLKDITLVGHSMGAHISGFAGAYLKGKIGRIVGLDPGDKSYVIGFQILSSSYKL